MSVLLDEVGYIVCKGPHCPDMKWISAVEFIRRVYLPGIKES